MRNCGKLMTEHLSIEFEAPAETAGIDR